MHIRIETLVLQFMPYGSLSAKCDWFIFVQEKLDQILQENIHIGLGYKACIVLAQLYILSLVLILLKFLFTRVVYI